MGSRALATPGRISRTDRQICDRLQGGHSNRESVSLAGSKARQLRDPLVGADLAEYKVEGFASDLGVGKATRGGCFSTKVSIKLMAKICSVAGMVLIVIFALGPANWQPRTGLGWEFDHFLGYFAITSVFCFAWPRPFVVGIAIMAVSALLEGLQAFTPDRSANLEAALWGVGGALTAALLAGLVIRVRRRQSG
jgi:VanZ family protein